MSSSIFLFHSLVAVVTWEHHLNKRRLYVFGFLFLFDLFALVYLFIFVFYLYLFVRQSRLVEWMRRPAPTQRQYTYCVASTSHYANNISTTALEGVVPLVKRT